MLFTQYRLTLRLGAALLAGAGVTDAANAQGFTAPGVYREDPSAALNRHLKDLADNPRGLSSLTGAAKAALELGDAQAAVTFYARAEEIAPRDGRIKAGIGAAFLAMEQPESALKFLEEARALGVPDGELASDRGLANDLLGNSAQAQRDYAIAMRGNDNDELRRRLALSRAITGDRAGALAALQEQLQRKDRAGWRVRAFVLALTGDANGATEAARAVMPQQAAMMAPFFARLPSLRPADRAMAVHFGHFPGDGAPVQPVQSPPTYAGVSPNVLNAGRPNSTGSGFGTPATTQNPLTTPTLRPNNSEGAARQSVPQSQPVQPQRTQAAPTRQPAPSRQARNTSVEPVRPIRTEPAQTIQPTRSQPVRTATAEPVRPTRTEPARPAPSRSARPGFGEDYDRAEGIGRRNFRPRTTTTLNNGALAQSRPITAPPSGTRADTAAPVQKPVELAANIAPQTAAPTPSPAPAIPAPVGSVQGPPDGGTLPSAVVIAPSASLGISAPVQSPPSSGIATVSLPQSSAAAPLVAPPSNSGAAITPAQAPSIAAATSPPPSIVASAEPVQPAVQPPAPPAAAVQSGTGLSGLAAAIRALPDGAPAKPEPEPAKAAEPEAKPKTLAKAEPAEPKPVPARKAEPEAKPKAIAKAESAKPSLPSRHWVQVAGTADEAGLGREFARIKAKAPKLFAGKSAWTTPLRFTNRLLVGPFKSDAEAQDFVNELAKADLSSFTWTSPAGQEIVKLAAR